MPTFDWNKVHVYTLTNETLVRDSDGVLRRNCRSVADQVTSWLLNENNATTRLIKGPEYESKPSPFRIKTEDGRVRRFTHQRYGIWESVSYHGIERMKRR